VLLNRGQELQFIDGLLAGARKGEGGALVLRGGPGIGLTTLLDYAGGAASDMRVIRVPGVETEFHLAFAGLQQLCAPLLDGLDALPHRQRTALESALGLNGGDSPDLFLVGLAVLTLLGQAVGEEPCLYLFDDAQWLDEASVEAIAFVARRLDAEPVAFLFGVHEPTLSRVPLDGLSDVRVVGLAADESRELLRRVVAGPLDQSVGDRLVAETEGNPLALVELPAELTPDQLAGVATLPETLPLGVHLEQYFLNQFRQLPAATQTLLLLLAVEPGGDPNVFWLAAASLGISADAADAAVDAGLLKTSPRVRFRHALMRSAISADATAFDSQRAHRAYVDVIDADVDPDRRVWHCAGASSGPDEEIAHELEVSAARAKGRGDNRAAAGLLQRAAELTPDPARRGRRLLAGAQAELAAANAGRATALLGQANSLPLSDLERVQAARLRASIGFALGQGADSATMLLQAARGLESLDVRASREAYLEALEASVYSGRYGNGGAVRKAAEAARAAPPAPKPETAADFLLDGVAELLLGNRAEGVPIVEKAIDALKRTPELRWQAFGCLAAMEIWDDAGLHTLATAQLVLAREAAALTPLTLALDQIAGGDNVVSGQFAVAEANFAEARELADARGEEGIASHAGAGALMVSAWRGRTPEARDLAQANMRDAIARGLGRYVTLAQYATAVLENGLGHYEEALVAARSAADDGALYLSTFALPELVEAAVRSAEPEIAVAAVDRLADRTLSGTKWARGMFARSRALISSDTEAEPLYREAIAHLQNCRAAPQLGRAHLLYGEWLRRQNRRRDARVQLRSAHEIFRFMGAEAFDERARLELVATGERVRRREVGTEDLLTPQEARIAGLVAEGASNPEIAAQLFISPRTVEYHLHKVFRKMGVGSRAELTRLQFDSEEKKLQ
jgi:DNA-binding CsgD family transcriptional regulator/tetratricopeptide (TPR) repeat protein